MLNVLILGKWITFHLLGLLLSGSHGQENKIKKVLRRFVRKLNIVLGEKGDPVKLSSNLDSGEPP